MEPNLDTGQHTERLFVNVDRNPHGFVPTSYPEAPRLLTIAVHDEIVIRVLISEPDPAVRLLLETQVEYLGFEVASEDEHFDIALVETAVHEGLELARRLRHALPGVPLVITSIRSPSPETRRLDSHAHLVKPFGLRLLGSALESAAEMLRAPTR